MRGPRLIGTFVLILASCDASPEREAYVESGCPRCHGSDLSGTPMGPPLTDVRSSWDESGLRSFLHHPDSARVHSKRLSAIAEKYPAPMPAFVMSDSMRTLLATYLLSPHK